MNLQRIGLALSSSDSGATSGHRSHNFATSVSVRLKFGFTNVALNLRQTTSERIRLTAMILDITEEWIEQLRIMPKTVTPPRSRWTQKNPGHKQRKFSLRGLDDEDKKFSIFLRQSVTHTNSFSCGIEFITGGPSKVRLARYNGPGHVHHNGPEHVHPEIRFRPHIHRASEKAYLLGKKLDAFAEETDRFATLPGALQCLIMDFNVSGVPVDYEYSRLLHGN